MSNIDDLYKRAFGTGEPQYNDVGWERMEQMLDEQMPTSRPNYVKRAAVFLSVITLTLVNWSSVNQLSNNYISEKPKNQQEPINYLVTSNELSTDNVPENKLQVVANSTPKTVNQSATFTQKTIKPSIDNGTLGPSNTPNKLAVVGKQNTVESADIKHIESINTTEQGLALNKNSFSLLGPIEKLMAKVANYTSEPVFASLVKVPQTPIKAVKNLIVPERSIVQIEKLDFVNSATVSNLNIDQSIGRQDLPKLRIKGSPRFTLAAVYSTDQLSNLSSLNIDVNSEITNVALVNTGNSFTNYGIEAGVKIKGWTFNSGVQLAEHKTSYKMFYSYSKEWVEQQISSNTNLDRVDSTFIRNELGEVTRNGKTFIDVVKTHYSYDSVYTTTTDTNYKNHVLLTELDEQFTQHIKYISVPVNVGFEHRINRIVLGVGAGINFNFLTGSSGTFYNPETNSIEAFNAKEFLNPVVYMANLNVGLGYNLNHHWTAMVQPHISASLNEAFKKNSPYATQVQGYGANFKLRYTF